MSKNTKTVIILTLVAFLGCLLVVCLAGGLIYLARRDSYNQSIPSVIPATPVPSNTTAPSSTPVREPSSQKITGYLFDGGLYPELEQITGLPADTFQISNLFSGSSSAGITENIPGYYLSGNTKDLSQYLGQCISVYGLVKPGWEKGSGNVSNALGLGIFQVENYSSSADCPDLYRESNIEPTNMTASFTGTLSFAHRPSPDIAYDYELNLDTPYLDKFNPSGNDQLTSKIVVSPNDVLVWRKLQNIMTSKPQQKVKVTGFFTWGFAESQFFVIQTIVEA